MRNSKKFKFLGKFFFSEKTWTVSISLPAVSPLVASPCGPPATSGVSRASLPLTCHSRKTPATYRRTILSSGCPPTPPLPGQPARAGAVAHPAQKKLLDVDLSVFTVRFHTSRAPDRAPTRRQSSRRPRSGPRSIAARADPRGAQSSWVYKAPRHPNVS